MALSKSDFFALSTNAQLTGIPFKIQNRKRRIISEMSKKGEITINEIAELLNISVPTATELTMSLVEDGLVKDTGKKSEGVGRKAAIFSLAIAIRRRIARTFRY